MDDILHLVTQYGAWPLLVALLVYVVKNGSFTFHYPRRNREQK